MSILFLILFGGMSSPIVPSLQRVEARVPSDPGITLFVREVSPLGPEPAGVPVVLVHGARVPGVASFDLPVAGGSLAAELARAGHRVFIMDVRGYGGSTRPAALAAAPERAPPQVRSDEAVRDIGAVVAWVRAKTHRPAVALFGWATGGHWCGMLAALAPDEVSHLVLLNSLYGADAPHALVGHGSDLEDRAHPGRLVPTLGAYALATAASLRGAWDRGAPAGEAERWRDPAVADAFVAAALASDPTSAGRTPPSLRAPLGALEDSFYQATGRQLWDASLVRAATLVVRGERDFWSRPEDADRLVAHLVHAARVQRVTLAGARHFVHLDRPEHGRAELVRVVTAFLAAP
jgi:pimeloyl-ACP methyl ester carboxylesterase